MDREAPMGGQGGFLPAGHVYHGRALIVLLGSKTTGTLDLKADSPGLASSNVAIDCR